MCVCALIIVPRASLFPHPPRHVVDLAAGMHTISRRGHGQVSVLLWANIRDEQLVLVLEIGCAGYLTRPRDRTDRYPSRISAEAALLVIGAEMRCIFSVTAHEH